MSWLGLATLLRLAFNSWAKAILQPCSITEPYLLH